MFTPIKNPTDAEIVSMIRASRSRTLRRVRDPRDGTVWYWPAEQATHSEGAEKLGVPYDRPPGAGDIVIL